MKKISLFLFILIFFSCIKNKSFSESKLPNSILPDMILGTWQPIRKGLQGERNLIISTNLLLWSKSKSLSLIQIIDICTNFPLKDQNIISKQYILIDPTAKDNTYQLPPCVKDKVTGSINLIYGFQTFQSKEAYFNNKFRQQQFWGYGYLERIH